MHYITWSHDFTVHIGNGLHANFFIDNNKNQDNGVKWQMNRSAIICCIDSSTPKWREAENVWKFKIKGGWKKALTWSLLNRYTTNIVNTTFVRCSHTGRSDECKYLFVIASVNRHLREFCLVLRCSMNSGENGKN